MPDDIFHVDPSDGFVRPKLRVDGVRNLERALSYWVNVSDQETVGAIGSRGGSPIVEVRLGEDTFALNRDTTRPAVRAFLAYGCGVRPMPLVARTRARAALRAYAGSCWLKRVGLIGASAGYPRLSCLRA